MSERIKITIERITCHKRSEFKGRRDNIYLKAGGNKLWPQGSKASNIRLGETIYPNYSCYYQPSQTITIELWEYDPGPIKDDFLGSISFYQDSNGRHKQFMSGDGGYYEVIYNVENPNLKSPEKVQVKTPSAEELYHQANDLRDAQKFTEAIALYDRALQLEPEYEYALVNKASVLNFLERYDEAIEVFEKAIQLQPDDCIAWFSKGIAFYNLERYEEALSCLDRAISLMSKLSELSQAWDLKSSVLCQLERHQEGIEASNKALELNLSSGIGYNLYNQAYCYTSLKEDRLALVVLKIAGELDKMYKDWVKEDQVLSHLYDKLDQPQASTQEQDLSHVYYESGQYQESIDAIYKAIELNLTSIPIGNSIYNLARCHALLKEDSLALANLRIAVELDKSLKNLAKEDSDFSHLYSDERFQAITATEQTQESVQ